MIDINEINSLTFNHSTNIQIRMSDIDPFNHVNNGAQCNMFDYGRSAYLENILQRKIDWLQMDIVLANITLDFISPILFNDDLYCYSKIIKIGNKSFSMIQKLCTENTLKTICLSTLCFICKDTLKSKNIPTSHKLIMQKYENL